MGKKVVYISYDGMTDPLGQSQVIPYLRGLSAKGHSISLVSAEKKDAFAKHEKEIRSILNASNIHWYPVKFSNKIPGWSAWSNYRRLKAQSFTLCTKNHAELVHGRSYIPTIIGLELKNELKTKLIFDMRGFWPDERVEGGLWNLSNPVFKGTYNFFKKKETELLRRSDAIISLTENAKHLLEQDEKLQISSGKIYVIPCCVDLDFFSSEKLDPEQRIEWKHKLGIESSDFILSYQGSLGTWYLLDEMLRFFKHLLKYKPSAKFLFITHEPGIKISALAKEKGIPQEKIIVTAATRNEMPLLISLSQISIFFIKNSYSKNASSPTKMGEIMALGIPVICNTGVGDVKEIIDKTGAGMVLKNFADKSLEAGASRVDELSAISKEKIRRGAEDFFSLDRGIEQYHHIYSSIDR